MTTKRIFRYVGTTPIDLEKGDLKLTLLPGSVVDFTGNEELEKLAKDALGNELQDQTPFSTATVGVAPKVMSVVSTDSPNEDPPISEPEPAVSAVSVDLSEPVEPYSITPVDEDNPSRKRRRHNS